MKKLIVSCIARILVTVTLLTSMATPVLSSPLVSYAKETKSECCSKQVVTDAFASSSEVSVFDNTFVTECSSFKDTELTEFDSCNTMITCVNALNSIPDRIKEALRKALRSGAVAYMHEMATVKWTPSKTFSYYKSGGCTWYKGTTYYGIPYTQVNRDNGYEEFTACLKNGKYTGRTDTKYVGNDCSSAVAQAYDFVLNGKFDTKNRYTGSLTPGSKNIKKVGSYSYSGSTYKSTRSNGKSKMLKAYQKLQPGDLVVVTGVKSPHVMMVSGIKNNGITVIHQTTYSSSKKSTWRVDDYWSFDSLYNAGYVPVTLSIF